jgi:hypothetical protein
MWWPFKKRDPAPSITIHVEREIVFLLIRDASVKVRHFDESLSVYPVSSMNVEIRVTDPRLKVDLFREAPDIPF